MRTLLKYFFFIGFFLGGIAVYLAYSIIFGAYVKQETIVYIPSSCNETEFFRILEENQLIHQPTLFYPLADKMNLRNHIHPGKYVIDKGSSLYQVIKKLRGGLQSPVPLIINNVNFKSDLAKRISQQIELDSNQMYQFLSDESSLKKWNYTSDNVMCLFIPNTYEVYWNIGFESFIEKLQKEELNFWNETRLSKATTLNLSKEEVFILASIVEKEYKFAEEKGKIARVYLNRLAINMKLQADPSVKFALGDLSIKRILTVHTEYNHPYNTYFNYGLPPGPICLPETSTIDAVLNAENHDYLYFCAKEDLSGYHVFNTNYDDHLKTAKLYQAALNKLSIYE